ITANAASRIIWYSLSVSVCTGATVMESPVCTPMGSKFSIEQTTTQLSIRSRITSISNSFQPTSDSSINTSFTGDMARPAGDLIQFVRVVGDTAATAAESEGWPDDERESSDLFRNAAHVGKRAHHARARH